MLMILREFPYREIQVEDMLHDSDGGHRIEVAIGEFEPIPDILMEESDVRGVPEPFDLPFFRPLRRRRRCPPRRSPGIWAWPETRATRSRTRCPIVFLRRRPG